MTGARRRDGDDTFIRALRAFPTLLAARRAAACYFNQHASPPAAAA